MHLVLASANIGCYRWNMERTLLFAILIMSLGMSLIPLGDTFGKALVAAGAAPFFVAFSRYVIGATFLVPFTGIGGLGPLMRDWRAWMRSLFQVFAIVGILTSFRTEPLANAFGAFFAGPIISYALSVWFLKEQVTWPRTTLLLAGFLGVLLVVQPGFGMTPGLAYAAIGGAFYGAFLTTSRWLSTVAKPQDLMMSQLVKGSILLLPVGVMNWPEIDLWMTWLIAGSGLASMLGNLLIVIAYKHAQASILAPFIYMQLVSAAILGVVIFGDVPDNIALSGIALILASGFGTLLLKRPAQGR